MKWLVGRWWFWALAMGGLFSLPLIRVFTRPPPSMPPDLGPAPAFQLVRESGQPFSSEELRGKVWLAARFSGDDAAAIMKAMHLIEKHSRKLAGAFELVSIVVDPAADSAPVLAGWAEAHKTNARRWALLTGPLEEVRRARSELHLDPSRAAIDPLVLVDQHGRIRGIYDAFSEKEGRPGSNDWLDHVTYEIALLVNDY